MSTAKRAGPAEINEEQLREAEQGVIRLLFSKRFSREWIDRHVPEAMAQAQADLAARIAAGREDETVGLLVVIAYRRALKALRAEKTKPRTVPLDEVFDLGDECARTPEQIVLDTDRQARLLGAMRFLPERDRQLLGLVYYGELDVKAAGHRLGWSSSTADRHHKAALQKLRALVGERSLLGVELGAPALVASDYALRGRGLHHWLGAAGDRLRELAGWALQRSAPIAEAGSAVGMSGAGRATAAVCGLAAAACMAAVTSGVLGPGLAALHPAAPEPHHRAARHRALPSRRREDVGPLQGPAPAPARAAPPAPESTGASASSKARGSRLRAPHARPASARAEAVPPAPSAQATTEFGVEGGGGEALARPAESSPPPDQAEPALSEPVPSSGRSGPNAEFGM